MRLPVRLPTLLPLLALLLAAASKTRGEMSLDDVILAVNAGGNAVVGFNGVRYEPDLSVSRVVSADSTHTAMTPLSFASVPYEDRILFQTERYGSDSFKYAIGNLADGTYTLLLRFAEVYFHAAGEKTFDVSLNGVVVSSQIDIFDRVGFGEPLNEYVQFTVADGKIRVADSVGKAGPMELEFVKNGYDNPKICAFVLARAKMEDVASFFEYEATPEVESEADVEAEADEDMDEVEKERIKNRGRDRKKNPYAQEGDSAMLYVGIAVVVALAAAYLSLSGGKVKST